MQRPSPRNISTSISSAFGSLYVGSPFDVPQSRSHTSSGIRHNSHVGSPAVFTGTHVHEQSRLLSSVAIEDDHSHDDLEDIPDDADDDYHPEPNNFFLPPSENLHLLADKPFVGEAPLPSTLHNLILKPILYLPAVFLGTLLNVLDGLLYGMIMFPVTEAVFSSLAPAGLSMFYISCIVSQLVYSLGGSAFQAGIGSEMIEVTPFFHSMALSISASMSKQGANEDAIIATTIVSFALSSVLTGLVFFTLGKLKLGLLVGFFPRHILVGCIGGVGYFLVATGIEVLARLEGGLTYSLATFQYLFSSSTVIMQWTFPLVLAAVLVMLQRRIHNSLLVPLYFIGVFAVFHIIVAFVPLWSLDKARHDGWVFSVVLDSQLWYGFYELYKFWLVDWFCVLRQLPSMLALTFFGILHVPINVPALAVSIGMDQFDVDRELVAHGYSNAISGLLGLIQNYLVYTNLVLFIRAGADARTAGVMLAIATAGVMFAGASVIGYIPICVVGALIYLLGYELLKESVYDTYGRLSRIEYTTILVIVFTMGAVDFVFGIFVGIILACLSFVVDAANSPVVQGVFLGSVARLTVLRHPRQQEFLRDVGDQICVVKLQGTVFFGLIGGVEHTVRTKFEHESFKCNPIKFLIVDMRNVYSLDFLAAEGFRRILNVATEFGTSLMFLSVQQDDDTIKGLRDAGLWDECDENHEILLFATLNHALEWCENSFLTTYLAVTQRRRSRVNSKPSVTMLTPKPKPTPQSTLASQTTLTELVLGTPRTRHVLQAAKRTANAEHQQSRNWHDRGAPSKFRNQPLPLMMVTFAGLLNKDGEFWTIVASCFVKERVPARYEFYNTKRDLPALFLVERGLIKSKYAFDSDSRAVDASVLPNTAFGDLAGGSGFRAVTYTTVDDLILWKLPSTKIDELLEHPRGSEVLIELLSIETKLARERFDTITANLVISG